MLIVAGAQGPALGCLAANESSRQTCRGHCFAGSHSVHGIRCQQLHRRGPHPLVTLTTPICRQGGPRCRATILLPAELRLCLCCSATTLCLRLLYNSMPIACAVHTTIDSSLLEAIVTHLDESAHVLQLDVTGKCDGVFNCCDIWLLGFEQQHVDAGVQ